jgi:pseudouridine-5'-phosphate glycosidase
MFSVLPRVTKSLNLGLPVVALESAVITHGLPKPENLQLARDLESIIQDEGATPATIAILDGIIHIGLSAGDMERLASTPNTRKISRRDFPLAVSQKLTGGTTVAGTLIAARMAGISVFATGGIGGVHRGNQADISADLPELGRTPMAVVCSGAKAILDLPATLEYLETNGVLVIGYQTDEFPAFYSRNSGLKLDTRVDTVEELAALMRVQRLMGLQSAILITQPPPSEVDISPEIMESFVQKALEQAKAGNISGPAVTPYLLEQVKIASGGASLITNLALLKQNAKLAARIAVALTSNTNFPSI